MFFKKMYVYGGHYVTNVDLFHIKLLKDLNWYMLTYMTSEEMTRQF